MSITVTCGKCGTKAEVPASAAGMKGKCEACGGIVRVPGTAKLCCVCGVDVSGHKRAQDQQGNYYCEPCWGAKAGAANQHAASAATLSVSLADCGDLSLDDLAQLQATGKPTAPALELTTRSPGSQKVNRAVVFSKNVWWAVAAIGVIGLAAVIWINSSGPQGSPSHSEQAASKLRARKIRSPSVGKMKFATRKSRDENKHVWMTSTSSNETRLDSSSSRRNGG